MDVDVRAHGNSRYTVHISLDKGDVNNAFDKTYRQLSDRGGIRGFRPGKVPRKILDRHYEPELIGAITYDDLVQSELQQALENADLRPMDQLDVKAGPPPDEEEALAETIKSGLAPDEDEASADEDEEVADADDAEDAEAALQEAMEEVPLKEDEPFEFYVTFTAYPRPELPDLSGLKLKRPVAEIPEEEIDRRLEQLRYINAEEIESDRDTIADGDFVVFDMKIVLEGEDPDEATSTQDEIIIGERDHIAGIDRAIIGHRPGDIVEVEYTFDEEHPDEDLAGKRARVIAEIDSFSPRELPELDDEFAGSLGDYETLDDLRSSIREQLETQAQNRAYEELRRQVLRHITEGTQIELPENLIDEAAERAFEDLQEELQRSGMSVEEFAEARDLDVEQLREDQRARGIRTVTRHFAIEALAREREIEVGEQEIMAEISRFAEESGNDLEFVLQAAAVQPDFLEDIRERALNRLVVQDIIDSAEIEDVTPEEYESWLGETQGHQDEVRDVPEGEAAAPAEEGPAEVDEADEAETSNPETGAAADENVQESEEA